MRKSGMAAVLLLMLGGCSFLSNTRSTQAQLERVAKDWCQTIRASQVLCVYPLTEDVQVGDIYLVSTPIGSEAREYARRGFLSFDTLLTRFQPVGYQRMYLDAYRTKDAYHIIPHQWQFPATPGTAPTDWSFAPRAAFPSYTFSVERGQGLKLAVPMQSVPVGLSLLNSGKAYGSIEIANAVTYGIDQQSIDAQVDAWASCPSVRALLQRYAPSKDPKSGKAEEHYIRIITRVYLTGRMNVTLQNDEQRGGALDAGIAQAAVLSPDGDGAANVRAANNYAAVLSALNASVNGEAPPAAAPPVTAPPVTPPAAPPDGTTPPPAAPAAVTPSFAAAPAATTTSIPKPGGSIRIAAASSRGITMSETFDRPLVVGYIAYDRAIGPDGTLSASTPTLLRVEQRQTSVTMQEIPESNIASRTKFGVDSNSAAIRLWLTEPGRTQELRAWLNGKNLTEAITVYLNGESHAAVRQQIVDTFGIGGICGT